MVRRLYQHKKLFGAQKFLQKQTNSKKENWRAAQLYHIFILVRSIKTSKAEKNYKDLLAVVMALPGST